MTTGIASRTVVYMSDNGYGADHWNHIAALIAEAEKPARAARRTAPRRPVTASRGRHGAFTTDTNVIQARIDTDGMAVYTLRSNVAW